MSLLTPDDIYRFRFNMSALFHRGYDPDEVDALLDEVRFTISVLGERCRRLDEDNHRLARARASAVRSRRRGRDDTLMRRRRRPAHHKPSTPTTTKGQRR